MQKWANAFFGLILGAGVLVTIAMVALVVAAALLLLAPLAALRGVTYPHHRAYRSRIAGPAPGNPLTRWSTDAKLRASHPGGSNMHRLAALALVAAVVGLAGCVSVDTTTNKDGSTEKTIHAPFMTVHHTSAPDPEDK